MESFLNWLNTPWGITLGRILFVTFAGIGVGILIKKGFDVLGFYSSKKRKEYLHLIAEFISFLANIGISFLIFWINIFFIKELEIKKTDDLVGLSLIYGSIAIAVQFLFSKNRIGKFISVIRGKKLRG